MELLYSECLVWWKSSTDENRLLFFLLLAFTVDTQCFYEGKEIQSQIIDMQTSGPWASTAHITWAGCESPRYKSWLVAQLNAHMKFKCIVPCPSLLCQTSRGLNSLVKLQHYNQISHRAATRPHHCSLRTFFRWLNELGGRNLTPGVTSLTLISVALLCVSSSGEMMNSPDHNFHCTSLIPKLKEKTTI